MNKWARELIKPNALLQAKLTKLKPSYLRHIIKRQGSLEKTGMLGKREGSRKRGGPAMRWIGSIKEARGMSL